MNQVDTWQNFLKEKLLFNNIIDGVLLFTHNLMPVYKYGCLQNSLPEEFCQFQALFDSQHTETKYNDALVNGFKLEINSRTVKFVVRASQHHSVYAISKANEIGIVVVNLPFGILVASHSYPITSTMAALHVEDVCVFP